MRFILVSPSALWKLKKACDEVNLTALKEKRRQWEIVQDLLKPLPQATKSNSIQG